jgi:hypothetical protein
MNANQSLGLVHQQIHEYEIARKFHEKQEQFASTCDAFLSNIFKKIGLKL